MLNYGQPLSSLEILKKKTTIGQIRKAFKQYGRILNIRRMARRNGAYVFYMTNAQATKAVKATRTKKGLLIYKKRVHASFSQRHVYGKAVAKRLLHHPKQKEEREKLNKHWRHRKARKADIKDGNKHKRSKSKQQKKATEPAKNTQAKPTPKATQKKDQGTTKAQPATKNQPAPKTSTTKATPKPKGK